MMIGANVVNTRGLGLIENAEGLVLHAYPDPGTNAEPYTIGYGHTDGAGPPPVALGDTITQAQAIDILRRDVHMFEVGVAASIRRNSPLNGNQFSALVSFAYNVGLGNFRMSSVLAAVNRGDDASVPRRLALWCKANGRTLSGLVKRRAAEGHLYITPDALATAQPIMALASIFAVPPQAMDENATPLMQNGFYYTPEELAEMAMCRGQIDCVEGKSMVASKTFWGTITATAGGIYAAVQNALGQFQTFAWQLAINDQRFIIWTTVAIVIGCAAYVIISERMRKSSEEGI